MLARMAQSKPATGDLDLNLVVLLDALLTERSVTRAAERIGLSQSAASHALKRLRDHFGDPLLVRTGDGMVLTERARAIAAPIHDTLEALGRTLRGGRAFAPRTAARTFTIATSDYLGVTLLPALYARIAREAPAIELRITSVVRDVEVMLSTETVDLVIAMAPATTDPGLFQQRLFDDRYVCVVRDGHAATRAPFDVAAYCAHAHALIAPRGGRGTIDRELAARGLGRRIAVYVPHWSVAPHLVARSDLVLTAVERFALTYAELLPLEILPLPFDIPRVVCWQRWHERSHTDEGHAWLRALVAEVAGGLIAPPA
jgi:DNA-binding transcriptional LysR family regulator